MKHMQKHETRETMRGGTSRVRGGTSRHLGPYCYIVCYSIVIVCHVSIDIVLLEAREISHRELAKVKKYSLCYSCFPYPRHNPMGLSYRTAAPLTPTSTTPTDRSIYIYIPVPWSVWERLIT